MRGLGISRSTAAAVLAVSLPALAAAQDAPLFVERVEVNVVNVEVFVADGQGRPVLDLGREDFQILEDGKPAEITNFYTVLPEAPATAEPEPGAADAAATPEKPPASPPEAPAAIPEEQRLHLLVYIDNFNLRPQNRTRVLENLGKFLAGRLERGDRAMLVVADRGVRVLQTYTDDPRKIAVALARVEKTATVGQVEDARRNFAARRIAESLADPRTADSAPGFLSSYVAEVSNNLTQSVHALRSAARSMAGIPGRKALLYVSDGLPKRPGAVLADQFFGQQVIRDEGDLLETVTREANAYQVTFYAFGAGGPGGPGSMSAARADQIAGGVRRMGLAAAQSMDYQEALIDLALPTGGAAILDPADVEGALAAVSLDMDSYYSLGFRPRETDDGKFHTIEVKVRRPGVRVRHRSGYLAKTEEERVADRTVSSLLLDRGANPLQAKLDIGRPEKVRRGRYNLPILVRMPLAALTLLPNGEVAEGRLQIYVAVKNQEGGISDPYQEPYPVSLPLAEAADPEREVGYTTTLQVEGGELEVVVGVWDELSGSQSFVREQVTLGSGKKKGRGR